MEEKGNIDYKQLYLYLFHLITNLQNQIIKTADNSDKSARAFVFQLQQIQRLAEDKYLELSEET